MFLVVVNKRGGLGSLIVTAVMSALLVVGGGAVAWMLLAPGRASTIDRSGPVVLQALADLSSYRAATGTFQVIVDEEKDFSKIPAFLAGERTILVATGSVDADIDFGSLAADAVTVSADRKSVSITLPQAQLAPAQLDHEHTYVATRQRGIVNRVSDALSSNPADDHKLLLKAQERLVETAVDTELRARAESNTASMLKALLTSLGFEHIEVRFSDSACS